MWDKSEGAHLSRDFEENRDAWLKHSLLLLDGYVRWNSSPFCSFLHYILSIFREDLELNSFTLQRGGQFRSQTEQKSGQRVQHMKHPLALSKTSFIWGFQVPMALLLYSSSGNGKMKKKDLPGCLDKFNGTIGNKVACVHSPYSFPREMSYLHW